MEVLDYCLELGPHEKLPFDFNMPGMIDAYYRALAFDKGTALAREYADICEQNLKYYFQFDKDQIEGGIQRELGYNIQMLGQMMQIANQYNQTEVFIDLKTLYEENYQRYNMVMR